MSQSVATPTPFNPVPHLVGIGVLGSANPLIYFSAEPIAVWLHTIGGVALLVGLVYGGYRLFAPARAKASGLKPFVMLAWVVLALQIFNAWTEKPATRNTQPASVTQASPEQTSPNSHGLQPFNGKLDQEVQLVPFTGKLD